MYRIFNKNLIEFTTFLLFSCLIMTFGFTYTIRLINYESSSQETLNFLQETFISQLKNTSIISSSLKLLKQKSVIENKKIQNKEKKISIPIHTKTLSEVKKSIPYWKKIVIKPSDNITTIFKREKINSHDYGEIIHLKNASHIFKDMRPNQTIKIMIDNQNNIHKLTYNFSATEYLEINRVNGNLIEKIVQRKLIKKTKIATGIIDSSFFESIKKANLSFYWFQKFTDIFHWKIDFARQIHSGDSFKIIYEEDYADNKPLKKGEIIAAEFKNKDTTYQAIRYKDQKGHIGYYTPSGKNLQTAFIRIPLKYKRISSPFNTKRKHPILHIVKPHLGVDFAAPTGTPVKASGYGKIIFKGRKGGYGKVIIIKHGNKYTTLYAHLSRFGKNLHINGYVNKGKIIGYVGETGFTTGPHLHYEFHINGIPRNPLSIKLPAATPIPKKEFKNFSRYANQMVSKLNNIQTSSI